MTTGILAKTAGDVVREALRDSSIVAAELPIQPVDFAQGFSLMNDLLAQWQAKGTHLWTETEALLPLNPGQSEYLLGVGGAHCFTSYLRNITTVLTASAATTISIPTAGITSGDFIGLELVNGTRFWSTVSLINSPILLTIANPTPSASILGAEVISYTTKIDRPLRIVSGRYAMSLTVDENPVDQISRDEYYNIPNKSSQSALTEWYYSPQLDLGSLKVWGVATNCKEMFRFSFLKPQYVNQDQSENVLIPVEWYLPLKWCLASDLAVARGVDPQRVLMIDAKAKEYLADALDNDEERATFSVHPYEC